MDIPDELRNFEERLLDPAVRKDSKQVATLLADDFVEFGSSGRRFDKAQILECLRNEVPLEESRLRTFLAKPLCLTVFLVTYRATVQTRQGHLDANHGDAQSGLSAMAGGSCSFIKGQTFH